jgi:hypothetical protein
MISTSRSRRLVAALLASIIQACLVFSTSAQDRPQRRPQLPTPVPMNPGPLGPAGYIVLVPIDDRPAVAQFAAMIGAVADHKVVMPPAETLGRFTTPGDTALIDEWLRAQDYSKVDALVVSVDMLAYGGLVASRSPRTTLEDARRRLEFFRWFKQKNPRVPVYAFNVLMRVAPTASAASRGYHGKLARWAELKDRVPKTKDANLAAELGQLEKELDTKLKDDYLSARRRDLEINLAMLDLVKAGVVDSLLLLQDDARVYGLHRQDQEVLRRRLKELGLESRVPVYNGADEGSLSLVSRAVLDKFRRKVRVAVVYSSEKSKKIIAPYEDHPLEFTVENQIKAAGGVIVSYREERDYTLYVNAPETSEKEFELFTKVLIDEIKSGRPAALADLLFPAPHRSGADERLVEALKREGVVDKLAGYAAWNTAGNTLGTAIPHANLRVFFRRLNDRPDRAARATAAHLEFLLHRFAGDYLYHDVVRLEINRELRKNPEDPTDEFTPEMYARVNKDVEARLRPLVEKFFADHFQGKTYTLAFYNGKKREVTVTGLRDLKIHLPWPRTFEVTIDYKFDYELK